MKYILIIIFTLNLNAQLTVGSFVEPNDLLDENSSNILKSKIYSIYSENGIEVTQYYNPVVTVAIYNEYEISKLEGMRRTYSVNGNVTLKVVFSGNKEAILSTISFDVNGVGVNEKVARNNAFKSLKINKTEIEKFIKNTDDNYKKSVVQYSEQKIKEAKGFILKENFDLAINSLLEIPVNDDNKSEITKIFKTIEEKVNTYKTKETEEKNKILEMQYDLIKSKIDSDTKLNERLIQENKMEYQERLAEERYLKMWMLNR